MLKRLSWLLLVGAIYGLGCQSQETCGCGSRHFQPDIITATPPFPGASAELVANHDPTLGGTAQLTFRYEFRQTADVCDGLTLVAHGYFEPSVPGVFTYVSGESSWVDTVACFERREHSVIIQASRKGQLLIQAYVGAPVDSLWSLGATDLECLCVK
jgi:hypothetical protein